MTRPEHRHKPPEPANEKMGMGHNRRLWVALSGRRHGTGRLRPGEPPAGTLTRARTAAPTPAAATASASDRAAGRSEEHTSELQSLMRISYAVFCLKKNKQNTIHHKHKHE